MVTKIFIKQSFEVKYQANRCDSNWRNRNYSLPFEEESEGQTWQDGIFMPDVIFEWHNGTPILVNKFRKDFKELITQDQALWTDAYVEELVRHRIAGSLKDKWPECWENITECNACVQRWEKEHNRVRPKTRSGEPLLKFPQFPDRKPWTD
jgi:hypothetical protein